MFATEGVVVEGTVFFVAKAGVCGAPFVTLVGYSEEHVDEVGKFGDGMEPDDGLPGGGGADGVKDVGNGFGRGGCRYELVVDQEGVEALGFGGVEGITVEMRFGWGQIGLAVGDTGKETELSDCLADTVVGVCHDGDDPAELGVLIRRKVEEEVVGVPLVADVPDLGGGTLDLIVYEFEKEKELGGCEA